MTRARENADIHDGSTAITSLGTVTAGNLSNANIVYPDGHVIKTSYEKVGVVASFHGSNVSTWYTSPLYVDHVAGASGSHIYVMCQFNSSYNLNTGVGFKIMKDGSDIPNQLGTLESGHGSNVPANISWYPSGLATNYTPFSLPIQVMDETGSIVKGTTYRYMLYVWIRANSQYLYLNRGATWGTGDDVNAVLSTIYIAEIAQ
tara:strand:- start:693 stop:1301 length:609 start_codon:yes stop_codon:yes gene_type:complete